MQLNSMLNLAAITLKLHPPQNIFFIVYLQHFVKKFYVSIFIK